MNRAAGFPGRGALPDRPGAVLLAADGQKTDVAALPERAQQQGVGIFQVRRFGHHDRLGGEKVVRGDGFQVCRRQTGIENEFFLFEQRLDFLQRLALGFLRLAAQARFHKFQVLQNHVRPAFHRHQDGVGVNQLVLAHHVHLRVGFLVRLDQLVGLVEPRILEVVFAGFNPGQTE